MTEYLNNPRKILHLAIETDTEENRIDSIKNVIHNILCFEPWLSSSSIDISRITGGLSNVLYCATETNTNNKVIIRQFGAGSEQYIDRTFENIVFTELSKRAIGPTFHGLFLNGRVEGFLDAVALDALEMTNNGVYQAVAHATALLHLQYIEGMKERDDLWLWNTTKRFFTIVKESEFNTEKRNYIDTVLKIDQMEKELSWLMEYVQEQYNQVKASASSATDNASAMEAKGLLFGFEKVLCHNDLLCGNLLMHSSSDNDNSNNKITLIDYEYASYNYRAFDIGNHFNECCGYECDYDKLFPSPEAMLSFLREYNRGIIANGGAIDNYSVDTESDFLKGFLRSVRWFGLASHLFWGSWAVVQAASSEALGIDFDYLGYAKLRFDGYFRHKHSVV